MKARRKYTREFKLAVISEVEAGKDQAQICREHDIHSSLVTRWLKEYRKDPRMAFSGNGKAYKEDARIAELERLVGQLYRENGFLKKALASLETRLQEQRRKS